VPAKPKYIRFFSDLSKSDLNIAGGKGANLGELTQAGIPVPDGYVVLSQAYFDFLDANQLRPEIFKVLSACDVNDPTQLQNASSKIQKLVLSSPIPKAIANEFFTSHHQLLKNSQSARVAVRSSATAEDLPEASFAGQQSSFLNIEGDAEVLLKVKECWASLFEARSIFYRVQKKFDHFKVGIAVPVQIMIQSEVSGVMFTVDPVSQDKNRLVIEAIYGLGDYIVQGVVTPDHYEIDKTNITILTKQNGTQKNMEIRSHQGVKDVPVPQAQQSLQKLSDAHIIELAKIGISIQKHYFFPQDVEWSLFNNKLYIVQSRPITTLTDQAAVQSTPLTAPAQPPILKGAPASPGIASGPVHAIADIKDVGSLKSGEILVTTMTTPDFVPAMKKAAAIVTDQGGLTSHAAIISRELGVPCVVGTTTATQTLKTGQVITVNGATGEVYAGAIALKPSSISAPQAPAADYRTSTKIYVNLAEPDLAAGISTRHVDGVGLLRAEFMMAQIGIHPKKSLAEGKGKDYSAQLAEGLATIAKAFFPRPVVYRASDFRTNEYRGLKGGDQFEPKEENPMLGFRGALRYITDPQVFQLELSAIKEVRSKHKLTNLHLMIPFVRTPTELQTVKQIVNDAGLTRSAQFHLWMMVEIPANVIRLEEFIAVGIDGVSIGTNDLTMLLLGADRDNSEVAGKYTEEDPTVLWALEKTVRTCVKHNITCGACGQAPSVYPDLVEKLVEWGITSVSVSPDAIDRTRQLVHTCEKQMIKHGHNQ
jgi:pyruvate,water dikinase